MIERAAFRAINDYAEQGAHSFGSEAGHQAGEFPKAGQVRTRAGPTAHLAQDGVVENGTVQRRIVGDE